MPKSIECYTLQYAILSMKSGPYAPPAGTGSAHGVVPERVPAVRFHGVEDLALVAVTAGGSASRLRVFNRTSSVFSFFFFLRALVFFSFFFFLAFLFLFARDAFSF